MMSAVRGDLIARFLTHAAHDDVIAPFQIGKGVQERVPEPAADRVHPLQFVPGMGAAPVLNLSMGCDRHATDSTSK